MLYHFELMMAGWVLLSAMAVGAVWLHIKRRRESGADNVERSIPGGAEGGAAGNEETP